MSGSAAGRVFLAEPPPGRKAREFQARLLDHPGIVDAVPEGGRVRFVLNETVSDVRWNDERSPFHRRDHQNRRARDSKTASWCLLHQITRSADQTAQTTRSVSLSPDLKSPVSLSSSQHGHEAVVQVRDLVRRFGNFTAVDHVSFEVRRGEIFGLLGPNGAGKTTTFRMLCGLLPATSGTLRVAGMDLRYARASARQRIGYVAQKFSLYGQLSVTENLEFFASAYSLRGETQSASASSWALQQFELDPLAAIAQRSIARRI